MATTTMRQGGGATKPQQSQTTDSRPKEQAGTPSAVEEVSKYRWIILIGLVLAAIMEVLDTTIINVALPQMAGNLGATTDEIGWVSTGYILSNVVVLPMTAWFSERFGRRNYLTASIIIFVIASFFCGTSHSLLEIVFWRIIQGAGGAALLSTAQATLREIFPKEQQSIVQTIFLLGIIVAPTLGPTLGGWITDNYTWNWCFFINIPFGIFSIVLTAAFLKDSKYVTERTNIDILGIILLTVGLGSLQYVLEEGNRYDWFQDIWIFRLSVLAAITLAWMFVWELSPRNKNPIVNFRVLKDRTFATSLSLFVVLGFGLLGGLFIYPLFVQNILHFTPTETGLSLLPGGIATAFAAIFCGKMLSGANPTLDARILILVGMGLFMASMWQLGHVTTQSGEGDTAFALIVRGAGLGFLFTPINLAAFATLEGKAIAQGSGLVNLARQLGGSFGIAVLGTQLTNQNRFHNSMLSNYIYSGNPAYEARSQQIITNLMGHGYSRPDAQTLALGLIKNTVATQALTQAYNDAFLFILLSFAITAPMVFLLKRPKPGKAAGGDMH